jgi:acyl-CoA synthetase (AMP-forming)/AMP-acid ligase II
LEASKESSSPSSELPTVIWGGRGGGGEDSPSSISSQDNQAISYHSFITSTKEQEEKAPSVLSSLFATPKSEEDPFHLYYTSGTTGHLKGVLLTHKIVVHHAVGTIKEMNLNQYDIWGHFSPMFHLVDVFAIYAITLVGGRHVTLPTFSAAEALLAIERERVSVSNVASTMITMMVNNPLAETLDLTSLCVLSCRGSPQAPATVVRAIALFGCEFFISYGMTETCGKISMSILTETSLPWSDADADASTALTEEQLMGLITTSGRPFLLVDVRIVDQHGQDVPPSDG